MAMESEPDTFRESADPPSGARDSFALAQISA
jgi:hypothetical protein